MHKQKNIIINKETIIPTISKGFGSVGFLFGAGTSYEAGYPLMAGLTTNILSKLDTSDMQIIETAINKHNELNGIIYDINDNFPDIEILLNIIISLKVDVNGYYSTCYKLEQKIKQLICENLRSIEQQNLEHHLKFLKYIKSKIGANHTSFWIFTTNYDLLFELACAYCKIPLENGFCGTIKRYFDPDCFKRVSGHFTQQKTKNYIPFEPQKKAHLKLCKLHGSLSWYEINNNEAMEIFDNSLISSSNKEIMIYPERKKLDDTLSHPYDKLFTLSSEIIGADVKYIVSCGYSYRDEHINDRLLIPKLQSGELRIFALFETEPDSISQLKQYPSFNYLTKDKICIGGQEYTDFPNDLWKFSEFVKFISE